MVSIRFNRPVVITCHAAKRMAERAISDADLVAVIDRGELRYKDTTHLWAYRHFPERNDNVVCAVLVLEDAVVAKTVMHHFEQEG